MTSVHSGPLDLLSRGTWRQELSHTRGRLRRRDGILLDLAQAWVHPAGGFGVHAGGHCGYRG
jgi:hypothetical protein